MLRFLVGVFLWRLVAFYFRGIWHCVDGLHPSVHPSIALAFARASVSLNNTCLLQEVYAETRANTPPRLPFCSLLYRDLSSTDWLDCTTGILPRRNLVLLEFCVTAQLTLVYLHFRVNCHISVHLPLLFLKKRPSPPVSRRLFSTTKYFTLNSS